MPKVSVLMPAYNSEKYIAAAIDSILNQTFTDFEFIIINDGSTDNTAKIVKDYAKRDKRIKFIDNKKNQGLIAVLNQGLDLCTGEYIARMDSDDISLPERFAKQVAYMDANPDVDVLGTSICIFGTNIPDTICIKKPNVTQMDVVCACPIVHPSVMMRREILEKYGLRYRSEYKHAEDYDLWARMVRVTKIVNLTDVLLRYRWHDNNISVIYNNAQNEIARRISNELLDTIADAPELQNKLRKIAKCTRFYNPSYLTRHMMWHHPIRWWKLRKICQSLGAK